MIRIPFTMHFQMATRIGLAIAYAWLGTPMLEAAEAPDTIESLKQQIQELSRKVQLLEEQRERDHQVITNGVKNAPTISLGSNGFYVRSMDSNFVLRVGAHIQADARFYPGTPNAAGVHDTFLMRRVRPIFEGTVFEKFDYRLMLDFGSGINSGLGNNGFVQEAYLNARLYPALQVQVGKFKPPVGLERLQSDVDVRFIERAFPTLLVPNRDVGIQLQGQWWDNSLNYAAGVFNGVPDNGSGDVDIAEDDKEVAARLFAHPFKKTDIKPLQGLGIGVAGTFGSQQGALTSYVSPGQQRVFGYLNGAGTATAPNVVAAGDHWRLAPQFYYYWGPFGLLGEYVISSQEVSRMAGDTPFNTRVNNDAWQVAAAYFLTGEKNSINTVTPRHLFSLSGDGWGAWEITARVSQFHVDHAVFPLLANPATSASSATEWAVGLNWYLNRNVKLMLDYEQTSFRGGKENPLTAKGEKAIMGRAQFAF